MFEEIVRLIVDTAGLMLVGGCLMRLWMQRQRIGIRNPVGGFVLALTDWVVLPLRRLIPGVAGVDWASIVATVLLAVVASTLLILSGELYLQVPPATLVFAFALVLIVKWALYLALTLVVVVAGLSWFNPYSPVYPIFDALCAPLIRPFRRLLPSSGRFDFSPMVVFLLIQIALLILRAISLRWIGLY
jgi:YggT family protein